MRSPTAHAATGLRPSAQMFRDWRTPGLRRSGV